MKKYLFSGLAILLPIAVTIIIFAFIIDFLTAPFVGIIEEFISSIGNGLIDTQKYHGILIFLSRVTVLIILFFFILLLGFLGQRFLFKTIFKKMHEAFLRIPFVKGIYKTSIDITKSFVGKSEKIFRKTVVVPFPHKDSKAIGFFTGNAPSQVQDKSSKNLSQEEEMGSVFVPTSPHPISGFLIMLSKKQIKEIDMTTEEAFKFLISCGIYYPEKEEKKTDG